MRTVLFLLLAVGLVGCKQPSANAEAIATNMVATADPTFPTAPELAARPKDEPYLEPGSYTFVNDGLKYHVSVSLTVDANGRVTGMVASDEYDETAANSTAFTAMLRGNRLISVKFKGTPPILGDRTEWQPDTDWTIGRNNEGRILLRLGTRSYDSEQQKWLDEPYELIAE